MKTTNREGYREYWSDGKLCKNCPQRKECFSEKATRRLVTHHVWQDELDSVKAFTKPRLGNGSDGEKRRLNATLQMGKSCTGCALSACVDYPTCVSKAF